ncbi:MAG: hypothetical protein ABR587_15410, partial [Candidatus Binatia bacterium]
MSRRTKPTRATGRAEGRATGAAQGRAQGRGDLALRDTERIVVAGPNAVEAVLGSAVARGKKATGDRAAASATGTIAAVHRVFLEDTAGGRSQRLAQRAHDVGVPVSMMGKGECDRMAGARCQGVAAEVAYAYVDLDVVLEGPGLV